MLLGMVGPYMVPTIKARRHMAGHIEIRQDSVEALILRRLFHLNILNYLFFHTLLNITRSIIANMSQFLIVYPGHTITHTQIQIMDITEVCPPPQQS